MTRQFIVSVIFTLAWLQPFAATRAEEPVGAVGHVRAPGFAFMEPADRSKELNGAPVQLSGVMDAAR